MIIDGHAHAAGIFYEKDTLVNELDRLGVDKVVLAPMGVNPKKNYFLPHLGRWLPWVDLGSFINRLIRLIGYFKEIIYDAPNDYLHELKQQCPDRIIQFYWANPNDPNILEELDKYYEQWHFSGVKLHQVLSDFDTNQESVHRIADFCEAHDMPLFIHLFRRNNIIEFIDLLEHHPGTKFIVGHLIGHDLLVKQAMHLNNYWFDISPYAFLSKRWVMKAYRNYGAGRLVLGSDTPFGGHGLEKNIKRVRSLPISEDEKNLILGSNMARLLGLS